MDYNKLVRDKIPEIIRDNGANPVTHTASDEEYWRKLKEKLLEEAKEFVEKEDEDEICDILEVIYAIADFKKINLENLELKRKNKAEKRGAFNKKIILDKA